MVCKSLVNGIYPETGYFWNVKEENTPEKKSTVSDNYKRIPTKTIFIKRKDIIKKVKSFKIREN